MRASAEDLRKRSQGKLAGLWGALAARSGTVDGCCSMRSMTCSALLFRIGRTDVGDQRQEELEPGSVGGSGVELDSSGKQCCSIKALKALCLAFSRLSCSVSFSICLVSLAIRSLSLLTRKISLSSCFILSSCCILRCSYCITRSS